MPHRAKALKAMGANMYALILDELENYGSLSIGFQTTWIEAFIKGIENIDKLFGASQFRKYEKTHRAGGIE